MSGSGSATIYYLKYSTKKLNQAKKQKSVSCKKKNTIKIAFERAEMMHIEDKNFSS